MMDPIRNGDDPARVVDEVLQRLRALWRSGFQSRFDVAQAEREVRRLTAYAPHTELARRIDTIADAVGQLRGTDIEVGRQRLAEHAERLKTLAPDLRPPGATERPLGTLDSAVAHSRVGADRPTPPPTPRERRQPLALVLPPEAPVTRLPGVGAAVAKKLAAHKHSMETVGDVLALAPTRHIDYSRIEAIGAAMRFSPGDFLTIRGEIVELREAHGGGPPRVVARVSDGTGWMRVTWFNAYIARQLSIGDQIVLSGELETQYGPLSFTNPEWELVGRDGLSTGRLIPIYPLTKGLHQKTVRNLTRAALDATRETVGEHLPDWLRDRYKLLGAWSAYDAVHYPDTEDHLRDGQRRLAFYDLLLLQLGHVQRRQERATSDGLALPVDEDVLSAFRGLLPFQFTRAQDRALSEILNDLGAASPMARLLQGDVGSGKTVVAAAAGLTAARAGYQIAVMAPTEILAEQHFHNFRGLFSGLPDETRPAVGLLTGSTRAKERRELAQALQGRELDVIVGTHALIQESVTIPDLALAIIDEQHRFGVRQRGELLRRGTLPSIPHVLAMTATPIPRTLNLALHGDLDVSVIDERPPDRIPIETRRYVGAERALAYDLVREQVDAGCQVFVICPLVEESEVIEAKAAVAEAERLRTEVFPSLNVSLIHGRMSGREKDRVMTAFRDRESDILVSTSVIEVGIDIPNATVMLIEGADRFGLSQLHQFRGRVGRGAHQSYCLLLADGVSRDGNERLMTMVETDDGFVLAQKDLELRGPGDFLGTRQSGLPEMTWLQGSFDSRLLDEARRAAETVLTRDPGLADPEHQMLREDLEIFWERAAELAP